jgi:hypothetical protein
VPELGSLDSVRGALSDERPYRDLEFSLRCRLPAGRLAGVFHAQVGTKLSNKMIQKGLAFVFDRSGSVADLGCHRRSEILPRRLDAKRGASVVRRDGAVEPNGGSQCQRPRSQSPQ